MPSHSHEAPLQWIDAQHERLCESVASWAEIPSGTADVAGLHAMADALEPAMARLGGEVDRLALPTYDVVDEAGVAERREAGPALRVRKRTGAPRSVFLCIHMDTVYGPGHPFRAVRRPSAERMHGPGVADAKGGIAVLLTAVEAFERSAHRDALGWEILITPDEEIGAPASAGLLVEAARRNDVGLLYEPSLPDGGLICERKGSGNFTVVVTGKAAHAGRAFDEGRNAIVAAASLIGALDGLNGQRAGLTVNVGRIIGGGAVNVVPDHALLRFNARCVSPEDAAWLTERARKLVADVDDAREGITAALHGGFTAPPKPFDDATRHLLDALRDAGSHIGVDIGWRPTGGVCDGNRLAAAGLPNIDALGARGGHIHSDQEFMLTASLTERAKLSALLLMRLASGEVAFPNPARQAHLR